MSNSSTGDLNAATEILQRMGIARDGVWTGDKACVVQVRSSTCLIRKVSIPWPSLTARGVEWRHRGSRQLVPADRRALPKSRAAGRQGRRALPHAHRQSRGRAEIAPRCRRDAAEMPPRSRREIAPRCCRDRAEIAPRSRREIAPRCRRDRAEIGRDSLLRPADPLAQANQLNCNFVMRYVKERDARMFCPGWPNVQQPCTCKAGKDWPDQRDWPRERHIARVPRPPSR